MTTNPGGAGASLAAAGDAMQGIIDSANKGQFRVTPEAGNKLIKVFEDFQNNALAEMRGDLFSLTLGAPLGDSPAGKSIYKFNKQVASGGDGRSYEELLEEMKKRVPQVIDAIKRGIQSYREVDEGNAGFRGVQR